MKYKNSIKSILTNNGGYSLLIALLTIIVISILGVSIFTISSNTLNVASKETLSKPNYYLAESALVETKAKISHAVDLTLKDLVVNHKYCKQKKDKDRTSYINEFNSKLSQKLADLDVELNKSDYLDIKTKEFLDIKNNEPEAKYKVITVNPYSGTKATFNIETTGKVSSGVSASTAKSSSLVNYLFEPCDDEFTIIEDEEIDENEVIPPNPEDNGFTPEVAVYTNTLKVQANPVIESFIATNNLPEIKLAENKKFTKSNNFNIKENNNYLKLNNKHTNYKSINTWSNYGWSKTDTFKIDVGNTNKSLFVTDLDLSGLNELEVIGSGSLNIYVKDNISFPKNRVGSNDSKLTIIYQGRNNPLKITNSLQFNGNFFAMNSAPIIVKLSQNNHYLLNLL
ncbi:hypothetical protein UACE39S_03049 [Ureibacillus acetophenoni]